MTFDNSLGSLLSDVKATTPNHYLATCTPNIAVNSKQSRVTASLTVNSQQLTENCPLHRESSQRRGRLSVTC